MIKCFLEYSYTYSSQREYNKYAHALTHGNAESVYLRMTGSPSWATACREDSEYGGVWFFDGPDAAEIFDVFHPIQDDFNYDALTVAQADAIEAWEQMEDRSDEVMREILDEMKQTYDYLRFMLGKVEPSDDFVS